MHLRIRLTRRRLTNFLIEVSIMRISEIIILNILSDMTSKRLEALCLHYKDYQCRVLGLVELAFSP